MNTNISARKNTFERFMAGTFTFAAIVLVLSLAVLLSGCFPSMSGGKSDKEVPQPAAAQVEATAEPAVVETTAAPVNDRLIKFGEVYEWENGVLMSASAPAEYIPTEYAAGPVEGQPAIYVTLTLTNGSSEPLEPTPYPQVLSGMAQASPIFDVGGSLGDSMTIPTMTLQPGQTIQWNAAYSIKDPADITLEVSPGFEYNNISFTNHG